MGSSTGRRIVLPLVNKSGGGVVAGDVVIIDTANDEAFTTTTAANHTGGVGIAQETIAANGVGRVLIHGYAALVNVNASVTRGYYGATHTTVKQAAASASRGAGSFCQFLTGGATPTARVFAPDLAAAAGNVAADAIWDAAGDLAVGTGADAAAKLTKGSDGQVLAMVAGAVAWAGSGSAIGASAYNNAAQAVTYAVATALTLNSELFDTDGFHSTSSNTSRMTIPAGKAGKYIVTAHIYSSGITDIAKRVLVYLTKGGAPVAEIRQSGTAVGIETTITHIIDLAEADYIEVFVDHNQGSSGTQDFGYTAAPYWTILSIARLGT